MRPGLILLLGAPLWCASALGQEAEPAPEAAPQPAPAPPPAPAAAPFVAEAPAAASGLVSEVRIEGLRRVEEAAIRAVIQLRVGESLAPWMIQRDLRAIWGTGFVDDVVVDAAPAVPGTGLVVSFRVVEKPAVREVKLSGNKKIDEDSLKEAIDIPAFTVLNDVDVKRNADKLRDKYIEKGYYLVQVNPKIEVVARDQVDLTFEIVEGRKVMVQRIDITGNEHIPDRKVRRPMQTKQAGPLPWLTSSGTFNEDNIENDLQIVRYIFMEEGYYDVAVERPKVYLSADKRSIFMTIHVEEGVKYKIGKIDVSGDFVPEEGLTDGAVRQVLAGDTARTVRQRWDRARARTPDDQVPTGWDGPARDGFLVFNEKHPALNEGDDFKLSTLQTTLEQLTDLYGDQGYAFANVVPDIQRDPDNKILDITFDVARNEKVRIGRIDITGNDPTYDKVIRREIPINEAETYRGSALKLARQRLDRLGYFEEVKINTPRGDAPDVLDMKVEVTEQPTGTFSVGAGFSNLENFTFTTNVSKNNFLGLGYIMRAEANLSAQRQQWNLSFFDPYFLDSRWTFKVDGFSIRRSYYEDEYQQGGSLAIGRYLDTRDDVRLTMDYTFQDTGLKSIDAYKQHLLGGELYRNGLTSTLGLSLDVDKRNNRINATRGVFASVSTELSGGVRLNDDQVLSLFGGDFNFAELKGNLRTYYPVSPKGDWLIFKYNGTLGAVLSTDGTVVPYIHRYRAGGINSVRGYDWYSLGPSIRATGYRASSRSILSGSDDPEAADDKLVVGGTQTWINNFELEAPIVKQAGISTVVFFDAGNAFGDPWGHGYINPLDLRFAYGFGIRWISPMGPLRFEWGFPINPREDERRSVFDFSIGSLF